MTTDAQTIQTTGASGGFGALAAPTLRKADHSVYTGMRNTRGRNAPQVEELAGWPEFLRRAGLGDLLTLPTTQPKEAHS